MGLLHHSIWVSICFDILRKSYLNFLLYFVRLMGVPYSQNNIRTVYCSQRDVMSNIHKSKWYDLIDMFNDTSRYLDDTPSKKNKRTYIIQNIFPDIPENFIFGPIKIFPHLSEGNFRDFRALVFFAKITPTQK